MSSHKDIIERRTEKREVKTKTKQTKTKTKKGGRGNRAHRTLLTQRIDSTQSTGIGIAHSYAIRSIQQKGGIEKVRYVHSNARDVRDIRRRQAGASSKCGTVKRNGVCERKQ